MTSEARIRDILGVLFGEEAQPALSASEVASHARDLLEAAGASADILERSLTERTVRYYQTQGIVTPPTGNTTNARYGIRQVLESAAARLAGSVRHLSLAEAAEDVAGRDDDGLIAMIADLLAKQPRPAQRPRPLYASMSTSDATIADAGPAAPHPERRRTGLAETSPASLYGRPGGTGSPNRPDPSSQPDSHNRPDPSSQPDSPNHPDLSSRPNPPNPTGATTPATPVWMLDLGNGAFLTIPADHPLMRSADIDAIRRRIVDVMTRDI